MIRRSGEDSLRRASRMSRSIGVQARTVAFQVMAERFQSGNPPDRVRKRADEGVLDPRRGTILAESSRTVKAGRARLTPEGRRLKAS